MTHDDDRDNGPYQSDTDQNTSKAWLGDFTKIDAKLSGMSDYAKALMTISDNLQTHRIRVTQQIGSVLTDGAFLGGFPEVSYAATLHGQNFSEFNQYLQNLYDGLQHSGNAAQAIADSYGDKDGFSAVSLNDVRFAFAEPGATRPAGLPSFYGETFSQQQAKAQAAAAKDGKTAAHPDAIWALTTSSTDDAGNTYSTYTDQYGDVRSISVVIDATGHKITTMTGPEGKTVTDEMTYSFEFGSYTTTTSTDPTGKVSTAETNTTYAGNTTTTESASDGKTHSVTTVTYNANGSQTTSTYSVDASGSRTLTQQVTVGQDNTVQLGAPDSPSNDALAADNAVAQKGDDAQRTHIVAPGPPNTRVADLGGGSGQDAGANGSAGTTTA